MNILSYLIENIDNLQPSNVEINLNEPTLMHLTKYGISYYSSNMDEDDKNELLKLYLNKDIKVLITTIDSVYDNDLKSDLVIVQDTVKFDF